MISFRVEADMRKFIQDAYRDGCDDIDQMHDLVKLEVVKRFSWLDADLRVTLSNLLVDQNFDKVKFDAQADAQEAGNE